MKINIKKYILSAAMMAACTSAMAQSLQSAYYTNDFKYRHTMNPAFANEQGYFSIPALGNINMNMQGNFGYEDFFFNNPTPGGKKMTTFMHPGISASEALSGFNTGDNKLLTDIKLTILSAGWKGFGGYNTVEISSRTNIGMSLPYELFEFAKNIGNKTYNIGNIDMQAQSFAEVALGHSRNIGDKLRVGAKVKVLLGVGRADVTMENMKADLAGTDKWTITGKAKADVSVKGFKYITATDEYNDPNRGTYEHIDDVDIDGAGLGGFGFAVDLGATYKITDDLTVNAAVLDLGFINWSDNAQAASSGEPFIFNGFHDVSVTSDHGEELDVKADRYADQLTDFANLKDMGTNSRSTSLAATINAGCEYILPVYRRISFGLVGTHRFNGDYSWTEGRLSANWTPLKWIDGGVNVAVNSFGTSCGWVVNFHPKGFNFFVGMDHILGDQSKEGIPLNSKASIALGMNIAW